MTWCLDRSAAVDDVVARAIQVSLSQNPGKRPFSRHHYGAELGLRIADIASGVTTGPVPSAPEPNGHRSRARIRIAPWLGRRARIPGLPVAACAHARSRLHAARAGGVPNFAGLSLCREAGALLPRPATLACSSGAVVYETWSETPAHCALRYANAVRQLRTSSRSTGVSVSLQTSASSAGASRSATE